jgi:hypothetical protein
MSAKDLLIKVLLANDRRDDLTLIRQMLVSIPVRKYQVEWMSNFSDALEGIPMESLTFVCWGMSLAEGATLNL